MTRARLDQEMVTRRLVTSRSQAESYIKLGKVVVDGKIISKPGHFVDHKSTIELNQDEQYVSRAGMKLASVTKKLGLEFDNKVVLDVGSSTGGFTDFALRRGAKKVIAVDVGTDQMHPSLRSDDRVELHEKTDIRDFTTDKHVDIVVIDVSFISLREVLPSIIKMVSEQTDVVAMVKPQFETGDKVKNSGVVKNDTQRRKILKDFEIWVKNNFLIIDKADSEVAGAHGNRERFYLLNTTR